MARVRQVLPLLLLFFLPSVFCKKKASSSSDIIEEVDRKKLEKLILQEEYLAVFFYTKSCKDCGLILEELEAIDDDASRFGVAFVKNSEKSTAKKYNVTTFPALMYFRNQQPAIFDGDLKDEEKVLAWLTDLDSMELPDKIEEVNAKILENLIEESDYLAVLIYRDDCEECDAILQELENIDDEADGKNIGFVKIADENLALEYGLDSLPALIYYRKKIPLLYDGDLLNEEAVLNWLFEFQDLGDENEVIEDVDANDLLQLVEDSQFLAVLFYNIENQKSQKVLEQLENIDDDCEQHGIPFVKIDDERVAAEYGIDDLPALVYFENKIPNFYQGDLSKEKDVLDFLVKQTKVEEIEDVTGKVLQNMIKKMHELVVLFYDNDDETSHQMLTQLENIDDDFIPFVKLDDPKLAMAYGITEFPTLVYFKNQVPNFYSEEKEDIENIEESVLTFLKDLQASDDIKLVSDKVFDLMIEKCEFLAVLLYNKGDSSAQKILVELEHIHDETDEAGIPLIRSESKTIADTYGIEDLPALVYFESGIPNIYSGELLNEGEVLKWLHEQQRIDEIEDITPKVLEQMIAKSEHLAVLFYDKKDRKSKDVLHELENIDDEADEHNMPFVRIDNKDVAFQYGFEDSLPVLVYFEKRIPSIYQGDLMDEQKVWKWLEHQLHSDGIEEVTEKILFNLIANNDFVAVLFYEHKSKKSAKALKELETISDEADEYDILFVKSDDFSAAQKYGIKKLPALLFFKEASPIVYDGNLLNEEEVLQKMIALLAPEEEENLSEITVESLIESNQYVAVFFCEKACAKYEPTVQALEKMHEHSVKVKDDQGIHFAKTADSRLASLIGVSDLPALVYFEHQIPRIYSDDLQNEKQVVEWIHKQKKEETIENINHDILLKLIENQEYLAVLFYADGEKKSLDVVHNLEKIDDDCSEYDVDLVKTTDKNLAKKYGVKNFPTLIFFRNGQPIKYPGNLKDENAVLEFITSPENLAVSDIIEKVNTRMFDRMLHRFDFLAVYFYSRSGCKLCGKVLDQLEKIDDEAEADGIHIVKNSDSSLARKYGIFAFPALLLFRGPESQPIIYAGDLKSGDRMLEWLLEQKNPSAHIIEEVEGDELRKMIETADHLSVFFYDKNLCSNCDSGNIDSMECEDCQIIMEELENIDSETDRNGIQFVKTTDLHIAKHYGIKITPALIYFENQVPNIYEGDLSEEEEVLQYLLHQKSEDTIETVNKAMLERNIEETQYLAVFFYKPHCHACEVALTRLELIDDDTDLYGINVVKICDMQVSKRYGIKTFPALVYFRNGNPLIYDGDLKNEEAVLEWLIDDDNRELPDEIETINLRMLNKLVEDSPFLAVYFYEEGNEDCERVLMELENIDDKCDAIGIDLVKISDPEAFELYNVESVPAFVFFRKQIPMFYDGDLYDEEKLLQWLTSADVFEIKDEIEEVNRKMLEKLLEENEFIAVFFYENHCEKCDEALQELERIDDEADDELEIMFVKIKDARYAKKLGITQYPTLVYFRKKFPSIYRGNLLEEEEVLDWLQKNRYRHPEVNLFIYGLVAIALSFVLYTIFLLYCYKSKEKKE